MVADELMMSGAALSDLMRSMMENNAGFRFAARGHSMSPFIKDADIVTVFPKAAQQPCVGDVVAAHPPWRNDAVVIHRVVGKRGGQFKLKGDNVRCADGMVSADAIVGIVRRVERNSRDVWFAGGTGRHLMAMLSASGLLTGVILPVLRWMKQTIQ
ncbi:MAG: S24/S26 family peptidase [Thermodesulfobacteriota bacterium]|nr:S24/S26 family peptidase [Thermodesulfobacteriota bacterium]